MKNTLSLRKALVLLSLTAMNGPSARPLARDPFFSSFNELFEELEVVQPVKNRETVEKDLQAQIKSLQAEAKKLTKAADELADELNKQDKDRNIDKTLEAVHDSQITVNETIRGIRRAIRSVTRARLIEEVDKKPKCNLYTRTDEQTNAFVVTATLPDIAKEDLKITVNTTDEFGKERQTLRITAQQKTVQATTPGFFNTSAFNSARIINGRREELSVENGLVTIVVDLPQDTNNDLTDVQKTMSFENNKLILSFPVTKKDRKKETVLRFSNKTPEAPLKGELK